MIRNGTVSAALSLKFRTRLVRMPSQSYVMYGPPSWFTDNHCRQGNSGTELAPGLQRAVKSPSVRYRLNWEAKRGIGPPDALPNTTRDLPG